MGSISLAEVGYIYISNKFPKNRISVSKHLRHTHRSTLTHISSGNGALYYKTEYMCKSLSSPFYNWCLSRNRETKMPSNYSFHYCRNYTHRYLTMSYKHYEVLVESYIMFPSFNLTILNHLRHGNTMLIIVGEIEFSYKCSKCWHYS